MKKLLLLLLFIFSGSIYAQKELNNYKYIIVPKQFDAFKSQNQYQTSTLVKYLLVEHGFNVVYDDALPPELSNNRCMALNATLDDVSNMFSTKVAIILKDCNSKEVFTTIDGFSKIKDYKEAYNEAIRKAFISLKGFTYKYKSQQKEEEPVQPLTISYANDVQNVVKNKEERTSQTATRSNEYKRVTVENNPRQTYVKDEAEITAIKNQMQKKEVFYAQEINNGFQLVDKTPKIRMKIHKTSQPNMYIGEELEGHSGLVYNKDGQWFFEYYEGEKLIEKTLNIKF